MNNQVDMFLAIHLSDLPAEMLPSIRQALMTLPPEKMQMLMAIDFKSPTLALILSIFFGEIGIDRFYLGDIGLGVGKLLTGGGCGIWWLVDLFFITSATKRKNYEKLYQIITMC